MFLFKPISKGDKKQRNQSLVVFPSPVFWQWGQWRKFQSNESFKKGSTLPSGSPCPQYNQDLTPLDSSCKLRSMQRKMEGTWQLKESLALTRKTSDPGENKDALWQTKKSQKAFCRHAPHWPDLEDKLETFVMELAEPWTSFNSTERACNGRRDEDQEFPRHSILVFPVHEKKEPCHQTMHHPVPGPSRGSRREDIRIPSRSSD